MAANAAQTNARLIAIAPAPGPRANLETGASGSGIERTKSFTCQTCARRKVKCDKASPICSSCSKSQLECVYQEPRPRIRKRKPSSDVLAKLAHYERLLQQHGIVDGETPSTEAETSPQTLISNASTDQGTSTTGRLFASHGKSRYVDSSLWQTLGDDAVREISDQEEDHLITTEEDDDHVSDPFTGAFIGPHHNLLPFHPTHDEAMILWETHVTNVEPICKILHIPSVGQMVQRVSQAPESASKAGECLLFAIYHFAVFSMTETDCLEKLGQSRKPLMQKYHKTTRRALVNASFLKTTEMVVLQAFILFLMPCRIYYDPSTFWVLTGVAVRIAQRMGLHRDGEAMGLPPFEVQMKRRLFYQLLPLEGIAGQMAGTGFSINAGAWDTKMPLNINDDQIWPGMTETPQEQKGATEMIFCLSRACLGRYLVKMGGMSASQPGPQDLDEAEKTISQAENEVEEKFIRYCNVVNPLHFLAIGLARAGITGMRLRYRLPKVKNHTASDDEIRELLKLAETIIDTDTAAYANRAVMRFRWHIKPFFLWGMWDSFILLLTSLWKRGDLFTLSEISAAWQRMEQIYENHEELLESKRALYIAFGNLVLKAWDARSTSRGKPEPGFITKLRAARGVVSSSRRAMQNDGISMANENEVFIISSNDALPMDEISGIPSGSNNVTSLDTFSDFNFDPEDWVFWDQLMQDYQEQS